MRSLLVLPLSCDITARFVAVAEYVHHSKPAAHGTYHFYHTKTPQSGNIEIFQREFRLALSYKLQRKEKAT